MKHSVLSAGPVGRATAAAFAQRGHEVLLVSGSSPESLAPGVRHLARSVSDTEALAAACRGTQVVYPCMGASYHLWAERLPGLQQSAVSLAKACVEMLYELEDAFVVEDALTRGALDQTPTPFRDALGETAAWLTSPARTAAAA